MKIFDEFEYSLEHESKLNSTITFLVKFEANIDKNNELEFTDITFIDEKGQDITYLIKFGWEYDCETIEEEIAQRSGDIVNRYLQEKIQYKLAGQSPY